MSCDSTDTIGIRRGSRLDQPQIPGRSHIAQHDHVAGDDREHPVDDFIGRKTAYRCHHEYQDTAGDPIRSLYVAVSFVAIARTPARN